MNRRDFVSRNAIALSGVPFLPFTGSLAPKDSMFRMSLNPGAIGVSMDLASILDMAVKYGYTAISCATAELLEMEDGEMQVLVDKMKQHDITWGSAGLPIDFRKDEATYLEGLAKMPATCEVMEKVGATRMNTWIMPSNDLYTYRTNFALHKERLGKAANIAGHHGVRLGLEYVGPKTTLSRGQYSFIRTMAETKELIEAMGESNVGFVLDSFHWYCAGESKVDLLTLDKEDIVVVDLNDARTGLTPDTQVDGRRELPMATGVIPIKDFMEALKQLGYQGPMRAEPFNQPLRDMEDEDAIQATYESMKKAFDLVG